MKVNLICVNGNVDVNSLAYSGLAEQEKIRRITQELYLFGGKMGGECYSSDSLASIMQEKESITQKRANFCLEKMHHSLFEHAKFTLELVDVPKILIMLLNNQYVYTTSERSARYTDFYNLLQTDIERKLYLKWVEQFKALIVAEYKEKFTEKEVQKLAQENARYMASVFTPTSMVHTISLRDINYFIFALEKWLNSGWKEETAVNAKFYKIIEPKARELLEIFEPYRIQNLIPKAPKELAIFSYKDRGTEEYTTSYSITYSLSFAAYAQEQRHRSIRHAINLTVGEFYVPKMLRNIPSLRDEWIKDLKQIDDLFPQGKLVTVREEGQIESFIEKCYERVCARAQLEIEEATVSSLSKFRAKGTPAVKDILRATTGESYSRCKFPGYVCAEPCKFGPNHSNRLV